MTISLSISVIALLLWAAKIREVTTGLGRLGPAKWYLAAIIAGCITASLATLLQKAVLSLGLPTYAYSTPILEQGYGWGMVVLMIAVQPALFEELAFRGVILPSFSGLLTAREAIMLSAGLFTILHVSYPMYPILLLFGCAIGWLRIRSGSLLPCITMHFIHNALVVLGEWKGI